MAGSSSFTREQAVVLLLDLGFTLEEANGLMEKASETSHAESTIKVLSLTVNIAKVRDNLFVCTWGEVDDRGILQ